MNKKCLVSVIVINSILLAIGVSLVGVSVFAYGNKWPLLTIAVHLLAILFPTACGQCTLNADDMSFLSMEDDQSAIKHLSWVLFGMLVIVGYAVPVELYRAKELEQVAVWLTVVGGTTILSAVLIYVRVVYVDKE